MLAREVGGPLIEGVWGRGARPVDKSLYFFSGFPSWADKGTEVPFCSHSFAGPGLNGFHRLLTISTKQWNPWFFIHDTFEFLATFCATKSS